MDSVVYIRESCERQNATTPEDFIGMAMAYEYAKAVAYGAYQHVDVEDTLYHTNVLASRVSCGKILALRVTPVVFVDGTSGVAAELIPQLIVQLIANMDDITPADFYQEFERIHPYQDGNGRVGSLLYNILIGTIHNPIHPPVYTGAISY